MRIDVRAQRMITCVAARKGSDLLKSVKLAALLAMTLLAVACGSETGSEPTTSMPEPSPNTTFEPDISSPTIVTTLDNHSPFNLADYANGDEIVGLMAEVGEERPYPNDLMPSRPELPLPEVRGLVGEFLNDSRVVTFEDTFRGKTNPPCR